MAIFLEQATPTVIVATVLVIVSLAALLNTAQIRYLYLAGVWLLLMVAMLVVEARVVTPQEEIESTLQEIARDLESNDEEAILAHISSSQPRTMDLARQALRRVEILRVAVKNNLQVEFQSDSQPPQAQASFNAVIVGSEKRGTISNQTSPNYFVVDFQKEGTEWKVLGYQRHPPQQGIR